MNKTLFVGATVWDASGAAPFEGDVLVEGNRISAVSKGRGQLPQTDCQVIDAKGKFLKVGVTGGVPGRRDSGERARRRHARGLGDGHGHPPNSEVIHNRIKLRDSYKTRGL